MLKFAAELRVDCPVEQVFTWLTTAENQGKFDKSSVKMEALTPGPWHAGTQFRELRDLGGRKTEVLSEVADLEPNRRFVIRSKPARSGSVYGCLNRMGTALACAGRGS
jgi:hypothetical protein